MFGSSKFRSWLRHPGYEKKDTEAPNYDGLANASEESARLAAEVGRQQLDFAKSQYNETKPLLEQLTTQQKGIADQTAAQGKDYNDYLKSYRPTERSMMYESMGLTPDEAAQLESMYNDNQRSQLSETGYLKGREADVSGLQKALGMMDQKVTETNLSKVPDAPVQQKKKGGFLSKLKSFDMGVHDMLDPSGNGSKLHGKIIGYDPQSGQPISMVAGGKVLDSQGREVDRTVSNGWILDKVVKDNPEYAAAVQNLSSSQRELLAEQLKAEYDQGNRELDYNQKLSELSTVAAKRTEADLTKTRAMDEADAAIVSGQDAAVYDTQHGAIDQEVGQAIADNQGAYTRNLNQAIRQGLRYGGTPGAIASQVGGLGLAQASMQAGAANATRTQGINKQRSLAQTRMGLRRDVTDNINRQKAITWAKKLDASGLVKGLPGASAGAYGLAVNAGQAAGQSSMAAGNNYMAGLSAGQSTRQAGQNSRISGLSSLVGSQVAGQPEDQTGAALGAVAGIAGAVMMSDRRLKKNIVRIGRRADHLNIYAYEYVWGGGMQIGVMADEVAEVYPAAVIRTPSGYNAVNYAAI